MLSQTYYDILEVSPQADEVDIKRAYRRLAQLYHPDKNPHNPWAAQYFLDIKEAYDVLSDPARRQAYHIGLSSKFKTYVPVTIAAVIASMQSLVAQLEQSNPYGINKDVLLHRLSHFFSTRLIQQLQQDDDGAQTLIQEVMKASHWLGKQEFQHLSRFLLSHPLPASGLQLVAAEQERRRLLHRWQLAWPWLLVFGVMLLCLGLGLL